MIKFKHIVFLAIVGMLAYACGDGNGSSTVDNFDHEAQAVIDNDSLVKFLKNNYYDSVVDSVKVISNGETALFDDSNLVTKDVNFAEVDYKLYYYVNRVGTPEPIKESPTKMDSVFVSYGGKIISNSKELGFTFDQNNNIWFTLASVIEGWRQTFTEFKGGALKKDPITGGTFNGPITYENDGKGIIFIPSGLAYRNTGNIGIPGNTNLLFYFNLHDIVENTDHDNDSIPSIFEDADENGDPGNDDTDGDFRLNYLDQDDDGDGVLTKDEDKNGDGDPRNDFNDPENPTVPDYLNRNVR